LIATTLLGGELGIVFLYLTVPDSLTNTPVVWKQSLMEKGRWIWEPRLYSFVVIFLSLKQNSEA
jgi:hypothetical protein